MFTFLNDAEDDPFFGPHMRHMRQMNNMMSSLLADPFGMFGGGGGMLGMGNMLAAPQLTAPQRHAPRTNALMPFMPPMNVNRLLTGDMDGMNMGMGSSYSSSTVVMSSGLHGRPQVFSSTSSTKIGPNGIKETRKTLEDTRSGTKKMSVGHHIGERAHMIEREQNVYSGDQEERQEFINLEEEEVDEFEGEFETKLGTRPRSSTSKLSEFREKAGGYSGRSHPRITAPQLALPAPPAAPQLALPAPPPASTSGRGDSSRSASRPAPRRPLRPHAGFHAGPTRLHPTSSASIRELYSGAQPQRHKNRHHRSHHTTDH